MRRAAAPRPCTSWRLLTGSPGWRLPRRRFARCGMRPYVCLHTCRPFVAAWRSNSPPSGTAELNSDSRIPDPQVRVDRPGPPLVWSAPPFRPGHRVALRPVAEPCRLALILRRLISAAHWISVLRHMSVVTADFPRNDLLWACDHGGDGGTLEQGVGTPPLSTEGGAQSTIEPRPQSAPRSDSPFAQISSSRRLGSLASLGRFGCQA